MQIEHGNRDRGKDAKRERRRLPYERPRLICRESLEAVAAVCVPGPPGKDALSCVVPSR